MDSHSGIDLEGLIDEEYARLLTTAYVIVRDEGTAREVVQEAFARLVERWDRIRDYEMPGAWLRTVTVRLAVRRRDRLKREPVVDLLTVPARLGGDHSHDGVATRLDLVAALRSLPAGQREVVVLYYLSTDSIAEDLGRQPGTIRAQLHQARTRLAALLDQEVPDGAR